MEKFDSWLDQIHDFHDARGELAYRAIYSVYRMAVDGDEQSETRAQSSRGPDGNLQIHAGRESITLADDSEREELAQFIARRYCGSEFPDMAAWKRHQDDDWEEDLRDYWDPEDRKNWHTPWTPWTDLKWWFKRRFGRS